MTDDTEELFKQPPRVVDVPTNHFHEFCRLITERANAILIAVPKQGFYRVTLMHPIQDDMTRLTIEEK